MVSKVAHLRQLLDILTKSVDAIELEAEKQNAVYPSIDDVFDPTRPGEQLAVNPAVMQAASLGVAAAGQLLVTLKIPGMSLFDRFNAYLIPAALRTTSEAGVVELLRGYPAGLHVDAIGAKTNTDPVLMARLMRLLATHFVFREVEPNVFANNRLSSLLDTGKSYELVLELTKKRYSSIPKDPYLFKNIPAEKYINTSGITAVLEHVSDEAFKSAAYISEYINGTDKSLLPYMRGVNTRDGWFEWLERPENNGYMMRMSSVYQGMSRLEPVTAILNGFDWTALPASALVVDLGGSTGSVSLCVAEAAPQLRVVIEDRPFVIEGVTKPSLNETAEKRRLVDSGRVKTEAHDFFVPQPSHLVGNVDVFLLRFILHDWPKAECLSILHNLHAAAPAHGRLLIVDQIVPYVCPAPDIGRDIAGSQLPPPPEPLLANLGDANTMVYYADMQMMNFLGAQERTLGEFVELTNESGWKIVRVYWPPGSLLQQLECVKL